ncbi:Replication factor c subunit [Thalictrum thalictroides]|uniref:Replication factor C subunit 1 n=1 Tax=Thalictrum thalictroides TaxID=46969 RepID=A0A7J6W170_THATH|nr:Replication factor c subunit [Thalictrum thalictroides]
MDSNVGLEVALDNGNGVSDITPPMEGLALNLDKENEKVDNEVDGLQVTTNSESSPNNDGLNPTGVEVEVLSTLSETKSSNPPKKLGATRGNALKKGTSPKDQKGNQKGPAAVAVKKKPSLSQSLSFPTRGVVANGLKKSIDGKPAKADTKVNGTDSKTSVYTRLSHPTKRASIGASSIEAKPSVDVPTNRRATLASVPSMQRSVSKKYSSVKAHVEGQASNISQSHDQSSYSTRLSLPTKDDEDARSVTSSTTPSGSRRNSGSGFAFRLDERAEKRKEFYSKIEEKIHAKEVEKNNMQAKSKESQEADIKNLRKNLTFKATPMPTFYKEPPPPKTELKKIPSTRPISPKLGRHKTNTAVAESSTEGAVSCQSPVSSSSVNPSKPTGKGVEANSNGDSVSLKKSFRKSLSKLPSQKSATTKTEAKLSNSRPKTIDSEQETQKEHDGEIMNPGKSVENPSQEIESIDLKADKVLIENTETIWEFQDIVNSVEVLCLLLHKSDIRKWFMKSHDKNNGTSSAKPDKPTSTDPPPPQKPLSTTSKPEKSAQGGQESSGRRKTSKYFAGDASKQKDEKEAEKPPAKRKSQKSSEETHDDVKPPSAKKLHKGEEDDDDFVPPSASKKSVEASPAKKLKSGTGRGVVKKSVYTEENDDDDDEVAGTPAKAGGRGRGGRGSTAAPAAGRGRGGGRGGFMNFGERKDPPHKGEKEVPEGAPSCLAGLTFVISGTLDSLEREEAEDLIKRHGGRVTGSVSKKTNYLLADEDIGGRKSEKAKELGTTFINEDGLFDMICKSRPTKTPSNEESKKPVDKVAALQPKASPSKVERKADDSRVNKAAPKSLVSGASSVKRKDTTGSDSLTWTEKYKPKVPNDIIGNQSIVKQLHDWLLHWNEQFLHTDPKGKGKKQSDSGSKKAVLLSGTPGIGKSTSAKLVSQMLGFQAIEVNASDTRGKADTKIVKGIGGSRANSIKELVGSGSLNVNMDLSKQPKSVLIMDEVDGMSAGDRGGVADLIASIKISKIPIICICNDRYSQKLKSLINYCLPLNYRKPTKQQMGKRLMQVANAEGIQVNEIALEELAERVNGDMRMAINQLQYMSLSMSAIKYDDVRQRLLSSAKDEDISPFVAVDKLLGFNGGKLRMDERIDLSMSDPDLVPLLIQENYLNFRPSSAGKDDNGIKRMNLIARAAESIGNGDIINVQIRRYRQWQLSQSGCLSSCIIPAALLHGQREILAQGERNFNRFGGWLGKNSTIGKNSRLLEDVHVHLLASREFVSNRQTLRVDYLSHMLKQLTDPLRVLPKDEAVQKVVEFMDTYSISQEDFDTFVELSKFQGHPNPLDGIQPAVKAALTKAYKQGSSLRVVRAADMITLPGIKKAPKKRIAAILEPVDDALAEENGDALAESEEDNSSDTEDTDGVDNVEKKLQLDLLSPSSKSGIQVELKLKNSGSSSANKTAASKPKKASEPAEKKGTRGSGSASKRKR